MSDVQFPQGGNVPSVPEDDESSEGSSKENHKQKDSKKTNHVGREKIKQEPSTSTTSQEQPKAKHKKSPLDAITKALETLFLKKDKRQSEGNELELPAEIKVMLAQHIPVRNWFNPTLQRLLSVSREWQYEIKTELLKGRSDFVNQILTKAHGELWRVPEDLRGALKAIGSSIHEITASTFPHLRGDEIIRVLRLFPECRVLDLHGCRISDQEIIRILETCPHLISLDLSTCNQITDVGFQYIARCCPELVSLTLSHCVPITDRAIERIAASCSKLVFLDLSGCVQLTDKASEQMAIHCRQLKSLNLAHCNAITNKSLKYLINCPLTTLTLFHCEKITNESLEYIVQYHKLTLLDVRSCSISLQGGKDLASKCPNLTLKYE